MRYSEGFKQGMVKKMTGPYGKTSTALAAESGVSQASLSRWRVTYGNKAGMSQKKLKSKISVRSKDKTAAEKFRIISEARVLSDDDLGAFLRKEGVREIQLEQWKIEAIGGLSKRVPVVKSNLKNTTDAKKIRELEKELNRKDKALAEAAALALLKKKALSLWGDDEE